MTTTAVADPEGSRPLYVLLLEEALTALCPDDLRADFEDGQDIVLRWTGNKADWERARALVRKIDEAS